MLCASAFMASLDVFIVNVAFDDIGRDFPGSSLADLSWVLNAYAIVYAALLVPLGSLADRFGNKQAFLTGLAVFTTASAACAASPNLWLLVTFRALQAAGAAALTPASLGLLLAATPTPQRARAVRIWAASGALAAAAGPALGGLLVESAWQWVFLVNVPVGILALTTGTRYLPRTHHAALPSKVPDVFGGLVLAVTIGTLSLTLVKGPDWGWASASTYLGFLVTAAGAGVFRYRTASHPVPLVEPTLFRVRTFAWSNATGLLFNVAFGANILAMILWMQQTWGYSAVRTGLAVAPGPLMVPISAAFAQYAARQLSARTMAATGCVLFALSSMLLALNLSTHPHYAAEMLPSLLISGVGVGLTLPTILSSATVALPAPQTATGSAVVSMSLQIGNSIGVALLVAALTQHTSSSGAEGNFVHGWWMVTSAAILAALSAWGMAPRERAETSPSLTPRKTHAG
ncbi:major facilitator superfamily MFS_1 [Actinobacteria bacterium OK006]|nr:major facilitator superfamily MFS_1 [Actinobacteria bacterium OK006]